MNENQVFVILKIVSSLRYKCKLFKIFIQTTFFRFEITIKKFNKTRFARALTSRRAIMGHLSHTYRNVLFITLGSHLVSGALKSSVYY